MISKFPVKLESSHPIPGWVLQELISREGIQQQELADILNVSNSTLSAWIDTKNDRGPTSTMELILFTLLVGNGVIELPEPNADAFDRYLLSISAAGLLSDEELRNPLTIEKLKKAYTTQNNPMLLKSKKLLTVLNKAWANINGSSQAK